MPRADAANHTVVVGFVTGERGMYVTVTVTVIECGFTKCRNAIAKRRVCSRIDGYGAVITALGKCAVLQHRQNTARITTPIVGVIVNGDVALVATVFYSTVGITGGCNAARSALAARAARLDISLILGIINIRFGLAITNDTSGISVCGRAIRMHTALIIAVLHGAEIGTANATGIGANVIVEILECRRGINGAAVGGVIHVALVLPRDASYI